MLLARLAERIADDPAGFGDAETREAIEALLATLGALARVRFATQVGGVIVEPATEYGVATALFVWHGRVVAQEEIGPATPDAARSGLTALKAAVTHAPEPFGSGELDAAMILHDWLRARADHPGVVALRPGFDEAQALAAVRHAVRAMITFQPDKAPEPASEGFANAA